MLECKSADDQAYTLPPKKKKTVTSLKKRLQRLNRLKKVRVLDNLAPEHREFVLSYKGPEVSGSKNKNKLFPAA